MADDNVWYKFKFTGGFNSVTVRQTGGTGNGIVVQEIGGPVGANTCNEQLTSDNPEIELFFGVGEDSTWLRIFTPGKGTYAEFTICATELDRRIAEGEGYTEATPVVFDGSGAAGEFVDVSVASGIVASIENTQALGAVTVSFYDYDGPAREVDETGAVYLNRNITIVPENQPEDSVAVRLHLTEEDIRSVLDTGVISAANTLAITKMASSACSGTFPGGGEPVAFRGVGAYGAGGYLEIAVPSFSEFFIHPAGQALSTSVTDNRYTTAPWTVAPDPVGNRVVLTAPPELHGKTVWAEVFTADGRKVMNTTLAPGPLRPLDSSAWPSGTYTVVLTSAGTRTSVRIVK
ncbi:T9SS type A sorting domain-containing protein [Neolewinella xylanilytica]|uniref:T9SS type A sorting domain-containing protein n=1 Tax=Neolewinella xylanilytica TaxID=1514080 RepID=UPI0011B080A2|nr:T9SS type A sorting domain-containing protein [Neolewinella xylanilytica]